MSSSVPLSLQNLDAATIDRFREIVKVPPTFSTPKEEESCTTIVKELSEEELQATARISYAYWALAVLEDEIVTTELAQTIAKKVARWHLQFVNGDTKGALKRLQEALKIRKERNLELIRTCFDKNVAESAEEGDPRLTLQKNILSDVKKQLQFFRGQDVVGRAVLIKTPRIEGGTTEQAYVDQQMYQAEKAAAVTEFVSSGQQETITAIFSMKNQNSSVTPPIAWQLTTISLLQKLFPGRMGVIIVLDAPFMIRGIFNTLKPFLSASLRESTFLLAGSSGVAKLKESLGDKEAEIFNAADGALLHPVDVQKYLFETHFYCPYEYSN